MTITISNTDAMSQLRARGIAKVVLYFSGGNDEGGTDDVQALDADGTKVDLPHNSYAHENSVWENGRWVNKGWVVWDHKTRTSRAATDDEIAIAKLMEVLEAPIFDRWGGFAGDFHVNGELTWDVSSGKHEMHGQEEVSHWEEF